MQADEASPAAVRVLANRPAALVSDIDGTLAPIVPSPGEAQVLPECRAALKAIARRLDLVAVLSGRPAEVARGMVGLDELLYVGNHGLDSWDRRHGLKNEAAAYRPEAARIRRRLESETQGIEGARIEDKDSVIAIHYRASPRPDEARKKALDAATRALAGTAFMVAEGKRVIELRPPLPADKGSVIRRLVGEYQLKGIVFIGDDLTDVDAIKVVKQLRERGAAAGLALGVSGDETPKELAAEADALLPGPSAVAAFLSALSAALSRSTA